MNLIKKSTQQLFAKAMLELLVEYEYEKITITNLCKKAGVVRKTFYNNFSTKDDIIYFAIDEIFSEIAKKVNLQKMSLKEVLYICFSFIDEHREDLLLFQQRGLLRFALNSLEKHIGKEHIISQTSIHQLSSSDYKYISAHIASAFICVIETWIKSDFLENVEYVVQITENLITYPKKNKQPLC